MRPISLVSFIEFRVSGFERLFSLPVIFLVKEACFHFGISYLLLHKNINITPDKKIF